MKKLLFLLLASIGFAQTPQLTATKLRMENVAYPFEVKQLPLDIQGEKLEMAYMDLRPQKPNGKNVLLLHGKNFSSIYWERTARDLADAGFRVVMPDQIGFGKSSKPQNVQFSFQLLALNTKKLLEHLGIEKTAVLGHSMGGMVATRLALMYPETVEKLILENPIGLEDWKTVVPYQSIDSWYQLELKQNYASMKKYQQDSYYGGQWNAEYEKWLLPFSGWTLDADYPKIAQNSARLYDMIFTQPVLYEFGSLKMPVLLIIGQRDRTALGKANAPESVRAKLGNYPELGRLTKSRIATAELVELDNVGHLPHIEAYDRFIVPLRKFLGP